MANISLHDQLRIIKGEIKPLNDTLVTLTHQAAAQYANTFMGTYKLFDTDDGATPSVAINVNATDYLNKMINMCSRVFRADSLAIQQLTRILVVLMAENVNDISLIENATDTQWEAFLAAYMNQAFELAASITRKERDEYNNLP